jgi:outer membrane protein X
MSKHTHFTFLFLLVSCSTIFALSDSYRPVRIEVGGLVPMAFGDLNFYGFGAFLEPKLNITDNLSAGLRAEWNAMFGASVDKEGKNGAVGLRAVSAYKAKADWFFTTTKVRPFGSLAVGLYTIGGETVSASFDTTDPGGSIDAFGGRMFGFAPQLGINLGAFRLAVSYNIIIGKPSAHATVGTEEPKTAATGYLAIDLAGSILSSKKE